MVDKWHRQQINQISGVTLLINNLLLNLGEIFTVPEQEMLKAVAEMLKQKGEILRGSSPGGG